MEDWRGEKVRARQKLLQCVCRLTQPEPSPRNRSSTPPGFSRWYFNFLATQKPFVARTPPGFSRWYFNFSATTKAKNLCDCRASARSCPSWCSCEIESPPAKAGGVPAQVSGTWCSCEIESPPAKQV